MISRTMGRTYALPALFQPSSISSLRAIALDWLINITLLVLGATLWLS